jgi:hypothetical protein
MSHRRPRPHGKSKTNPTRSADPPEAPATIPSSGPSPDNRPRPECRHAPPGSARIRDARPSDSREAFPIYRPLWRDPDRLDFHPIPDESWDVFKSEDDTEPEPETGDFWMQADDEHGG